jgi:cytochrome c553
MQKWKLGTLLIVAAATTLGASRKDEKKDGEFKNLKVLPKDISKKALDSIMFEFSVSLGVRCNFCHARMADTSNHHLDFASDAKDEKDIARHMFKMTAALNGGDFNFKNSSKPDTIHIIICYTCHRGKKDPGSDNIIPELNALKQERMMEWSGKRKH